VAYGLATLLAIITVVLGLSAASNIGLPTRSATIETLAAADEEDLAEALRLRRTAGDAIWPGWGAADIPLILYNESYAFLTGYPDPPPGWTKVPQGLHRGGPWQPVPDDLFQGATYYRQPLPGRDITPEAFTVRVGDRWAASMTTYEWTQIGLATNIRRQLPAVFRPVFPYRLAIGLAISRDLHVFALAHESFHAYQGWVAPGRLAAGESASARHETLYPWGDRALRRGWRAELEILAGGIQATSSIEATAQARRFLIARDERRRAARLDSELVDYERQREWVEGLAKYTELEVWKRAGYPSFGRQWSKELATLPRAASDLSDRDVRFYYSGLAQAVMLDRLRPGWRDRILDDGVWLEDLLEQASAR
jgi:hypothetical protein